MFAVSEFRALWLAQLLSVVGDQLARVALTILVFDRTRSAFLAAVTFVASVVPTFVGGVTLSWLADRYPRRRVMIVCDLLRCGLVLIMAIHGMPLASLVVLLFVVTLVGAPFTSARAAVYPDVLDGDKYVVGTAVTLTTNQFAQVIGFAVGGAVDGFLGTGRTLLIDAATFAASAIIVRVWVRARPAPRALPYSGVPAVSSSGLRLVFGNPALRITMLFGWLSAFYNAPEGVVTPLAKHVGGGAIAVGVILASEALGETIGAIAFSRFVSPPERLRAMGPLAVISCALLVLFAAGPTLFAVLVILFAGGLSSCYQLAANAAFVSATPREKRSQAFGIAQGGISLGQGTVMIVAGAVAERVSPSLIIAVCGGIGAVAAVGLAIGWSRSQRGLGDRGRSSGLGPADGTH